MYMDHTGKKFKYLQDMCEHWDVRPETYNRRIKVYGWSTEKALTTKVKPNGGVRCRDHEGRFFRTVTKMCDYWGIYRKTYAYRIAHGWSQEAALTTPARGS